MVTRAATAALTLAAVVGLVVALAGAAGEAGANANPKPTPSPSPSPTAAYSITDLGSLGGGYTEGLALNNNGQVTGYSAISKTIETGGCCGGCYPGGKRKPCTTHPTHAFLWSAGTMTDLGTLGGNYSQGDAINASGEVVGSAETSAGSSSFLWNGTKLIPISGLSASGINDSGQIAGGCAGTPGNHVCLLNNGSITVLPDPTTFTPGNCDASAINNNGQIFGNCDDTSSDLHAVIWQNGTPTDLGTFGGPQAEAAGMNNLGQVVGFAQTSTDADHGFLWTNGTMTDLGLNFFPAAINDSGVIVGSGQIDSGGILQNLNNLIPAGSGYSITSEQAINDNGQILVQAGGHALLLTPS